MARSVTIIAGQYNVLLPNGLSYNATHPTSTNGPTVYLSDEDGSRLNPAGAGVFYVDNGTVEGSAREVTLVAGQELVQLPNGLPYSATNPAEGANGPIVYLSAEDGSRLNPSVVTDGVLADEGPVVPPVRSVTVIAGQENVELPNGIAYSSSDASGTIQITAVSGNGTLVTFTAANSLTPGTEVTLSGLAGGFTSLNGVQTVDTATGTAFTVANTTEGATTTGTASVDGPTVYLDYKDGSVLVPGGAVIDNGWAETYS